MAANVVGTVKKKFVSNQIIIPLYFVLTGLLYAGFFSILMGYKWVTKTQLSYYRTFIQIFIAVVLLIRFGSFRKKHRYIEGDSTLISASAYFIIINIFIANFKSI
jgi:hypothetical protein